MIEVTCPVCKEEYDGDGLEELDEDYEDCLGGATCPVICRKCGTKLNLDAFIDWELTLRGRTPIGDYLVPKDLNTIVERMVEKGEGTLAAWADIILKGRKKLNRRKKE